MDDGEKPDWWLKNEQARASMDLPTYEPPRFDDGVYAHEVVSDLEEAYDCDITFIGINVEYTEDWEVWVNEETVLTVSRSRNEDGNTVYHIESDVFEEKIKQAVA